MAQRAKDNQQRFAIKAPAAMSVVLVGDFTHWQKNPIPMRKNSDGVWTASISLPPGKHSYRFLIDGQWREDPECGLRVPNPYGEHNSVREVAEAFLSVPPGFRP